MPTTKAAAAEFALKSYIAEATPETLNDLSDGPKLLRKLREAVDLTEAPEDAACSLVVDLMHYCEREKIDWSKEVLSRARERFAADHNS
jgi:hypothetical protein